MVSPESWFALPQKPYQLDGKTRYQSILGFPDKDHYWSFVGAMLDAIESYKNQVKQ